MYDSNIFEQIINKLFIKFFLGELQVFECWDIWEWDRIMPYTVEISNKSSNAGEDQHSVAGLFRNQI